MRVKVAVPIQKPLRRGGFIAGSNGARSWVTFKYELLPLFCQYCGLLGHDVKHCASHFAVSRNGGEVDYQYGESLRALGGHPYSFPSRNTYGIAGPVKEQTSEESTNYSAVQGTFPIAGVEDTNPSKQEVESKNLGELPIFQEETNVELGGTDDVWEGHSLQLVPSLVCEDTDVDLMREVTGPPAGVDCMEMATGKTKEDGFGVEASGLDQRLKLVGPNSIKPKSTWTRFNRMDFGLEDCLKLCSCQTVEKGAVYLVGRKSCVTMLILGRLSMERLMMEMLEPFYRRGWRTTLAGSNEDPKLEMPRAWEPFDRL